MFFKASFSTRNSVKTLQLIIIMKKHPPEELNPFFRGVSVFLYKVVIDINNL